MMSDRIVFGSWVLMTIRADLIAIGFQAGRMWIMAVGAADATIGTSCFEGMNMFIDLVSDLAIGKIEIRL